MRWYRWRFWFVAWALSGRGCMVVDGSGTWVHALGRVWLRVSRERI